MTSTDIITALREEIAALEASNRIRGDELARLREELALTQGTLESRERNIETVLAESARLREQEPVAHEFQDRYGEWCPFTCDEHYHDTVADGTWPIRALYAAPPAQPAEPKRTQFEADIMRDIGYAEKSQFEADLIESVGQMKRGEAVRVHRPAESVQPQWRPEWPAFVEYWAHESHLQTFEDRERFRAAVKEMIHAAPKGTT